MEESNQQPERKTLDQRHKMSDLERIRHSCAHVLATAIAKLWPDAQFAAGPPVETGFYYDVDLEHRISPEDFPAIEAEMKKVVKENQTFEKLIVSRDQALADAQKGRLAALAERPVPSRFKLDIVQNIPEGEPISYYKNGEFIDLCAGPHVMRTGNIGAYRLTHVASAYYKGDEKNPQLQRIYGTAFKTKKELDDYFAMLEEAKKRDHRKLGKELELFVFDDDVGPGLPLWLPRGAAIIEELEKLAKETEFAAGYQRVRTPHIARENLYLKSGHIPYYEESMFPPMELRGEGIYNITHSRIRKRRDEQNKGLADFLLPDWNDLLQSSATSEQFQEAIRNRIAEARSKLGEKFKTIEDNAITWLLMEAKGYPINDRIYLKAMNCSHHHKLFAAVPRSYRDLPLRLAEYGTCYR